MLTENADGQVSLFAQDTQSTKTSPARTAVTWGGTSGKSLRSLSESRSRTPQRFLYLKRENGPDGTLSWETDGALLGGRTTRSIGAFRSEESGFACSLTSPDGRRETYFLTLNSGEKPRKPIPSRLSQILERNPDPKYDLSAKACTGILNRAARRGKELPAELKAALQAQSQPPTGKNGTETREITAAGISPLSRETPQSAYRGTESTVPTPPDATDAAGAGGGSYTLNTIDRPAVYLEDQGGCDGGGKGPLIQTDKSATLSTLQDQTLFAPPVANTLTRRYDGSPQPDKQNGANIVVTAGFSMGQSEKARSIGYQEEVSPTIRGGKEVTRSRVCCGNPWDSQSERVFHGGGAWHSLSANENGGQSRDAVLTAIPINTMVGTRETAETRTTFGVGEEGDPQFTLSAAHEHAVFAFAQNQRDEVRDLRDVAGALAAEPGMKQQTFVCEEKDGNGENQPDL